MVVLSGESRERYFATIIYPRHDYRKAWRRGVYMCTRCRCIRQTTRVRAGEYMPGGVMGHLQEPHTDHPAWRLTIPECSVVHRA